MALYTYDEEILAKEGVSTKVRPRTKKTPEYMPPMFDYGLKHAISVNSEYGGLDTWVRVFGSEDAALIKLTDEVTETFKRIPPEVKREPDLRPATSAVIEHSVSAVEFRNRKAMMEEFMLDTK